MKTDEPHLAGSPQDSAHDVVEEGSDLQAEMSDLSPEEQAEMLAHLRMLKDKRQQRSVENQAVGMEKAKADEDLSLEDKVRARQERNVRDVIDTKTPAGFDTRTARSTQRRERELEVGKDSVYDKFDENGQPMRVRIIPDERRMGEKIVGTPRTMQTGRPDSGRTGESTYGVHMHSGSMTRRNLPVGGGKESSAPVHADKEGKSYITGGHSDPKLRHAMVGDGQSRINPNLPKSENMMKSEYSPAEVALEILKKTESMYKAKTETWDDQKPEKILKDAAYNQTREVANENDIAEKVREKLADNSVKRLESFLTGRKAKKVK